MQRLQNKKAVITGGSRGIGKAIAEAYLREGAEVYLLARSADELQETQRELAALGKVSSAVADVSQQKDIERIAGQVTKELGTIDILVNAAGVYGPIGLVTEVDPTEWKKAIEVNLFGVFLSVHFFAPLMKQGGGSIINFVGGGEGAYAHFSSYVAAKGGIARFTETIAAELKGSKIYANAISPGAVNTRFLDDILRAGPEKAGKENYERAIKQRDSGGASPEDAAGLAVFLASKDAEGITGKILSAIAPYETFPEHKEDIMSSDVYTVRRVWPEDRGFDWGQIKK